eukprot:SM000261S09961  [mRNA]  locus=s261:48374:50635:+ [translate_table: standard]
MEVIKDVDAMRAWSRAVRRRGGGGAVALVPTMGYLHDGHLSLVREARRLAGNAGVVVVSIYVNPGQFAPTEDLATYPRDTAGDLSKLETLSIDAVFLPADLYVRDAAASVSTAAALSNSGAASSRDAVGNAEGLPATRSSSSSGGHETWIQVERLQQGLCGRSRPTFFRGVATVVAKLFNIVEPDIAVFGRKDYQQWLLIQRMVRDLNFAVEVVGVPLLREPDGLAMSSRNVHLDPDQRRKALSISTALQEVSERVQSHELDAQPLEQLVISSIQAAGGRVDYVEMVGQESLDRVERITKPCVLAVAAWFGSVRLLDNVELQPSGREASLS